MSNKNIIDWHTDQAYHGDKKPEKYVKSRSFNLKIFIYLTDVNPLNGCMSYIPGSHKIGYAIRKGIFEKKISYRIYWHLKDFRKLITSEENKEYFQNYFKIQKYLLEKFLDVTNNLTNQSSSHNFDYTLKAGAIIFDEVEYTKAQKTLQQDRMVLRYIYSNFK